MSAREEAKKLIAERDEIDALIADNEAILKLNNTDMTAPLVDAEGFPDSKIDVYSVRHARHNIICLKNDRKELTEKIESLMVQAHEEARQYSETSEESENAAPIVHRTSNKPFVKIGTVTLGSPADADGFHKGDEVIQFGPLHADNFQKLDDIAAVVKDSVGKPIRVTMLRNMRATRLVLTPRVWSGKGVVGCAFEPIC